MFAYVVALSCIIALIQAHIQTKCPDFQAFNGVFRSATKVCDEHPQCGPDGNPVNPQLCRPRFCVQEKVLNYQSSGVLFDTKLIYDNTQANCDAVVSKDVTKALRGTQKKFVTNCPDFKIVLTLKAPTNPAWTVSYIRFKTVKIDKVTITIGNNPSFNILHPVSVAQTVNQTGNSFTFSFHSAANTDEICTYMVYLLEVVLCPPVIVTTTQTPTTTPVITTTSAPTTTSPPTTTPLPTLPPVRFCNLTTTLITEITDNLGRVCTSDQPLFIYTCSGQCPTSTIGQAIFTDNTCIAPTVPFKIKDCTCCDGDGNWFTYPVVCEDQNTGDTVDEFYSIFQMTSCSCVKCCNQCTA